ncbi:MAG: helix-turn-helix transcriptional regulator [Litorilinea sp.]
MRELGALLRERREAMGVSLAEVEVATRIRQKYLSALEADEWHLLPGEVVGRGFLRNYADYLGLEPDETIDRRRAVSDLSLGTTLADTSAGSNLPPLREVDYRPKEVDLKDEGDGIHRSEIRLTPIFAIVGVALLVVAAWWSITALAGPMGAFFADLPDRIAGSNEEVIPSPEPPTPEPLAGVINPENIGLAASEQTPAAGVEQADAAPNAEQSALTGTGGPVATDNAQTEPPGAVLVPTNTPAQAASEQPVPEQPAPEQPAAEQPAAAPAAETAADDTVVILPTATPTPPEAAPVAAPDVVAAACGDARSAISIPGLNQVVGGVLGVSGNATHENFQYFKLEYAPGANAGGGFVYFAGSNTQVNGGVLGNLDTRALPNGEYTIRLTVVDQSSNYPPPCDVSFVIQN